MNISSFNVFVSLINQGKTEGLRIKADAIHKRGGLTDDEHTKIVELLMQSERK